MCWAVVGSWASHIPQHSLSICFTSSLCFLMLVCLLQPTPFSRRTIRFSLLRWGFLWMRFAINNVIKASRIKKRERAVNEWRSWSGFTAESLEFNCFWYCWMHMLMCFSSSPFHSLILDSICIGKCVSLSALFTYVAVDSTGEQDEEGGWWWHLILTSI